MADQRAHIPFGAGRRIPELIRPDAGDDIGRHAPGAAMEIPRIRHNAPSSTMTPAEPATPRPGPGNAAGPASEAVTAGIISPAPSIVGRKIAGLPVTTRRVLHRLAALHPRVSRCAAGERDALIEPEQAGPARVVLDGHRDVSHVCAEVLGQPVQCGTILEAVQFDVDHQLIVRPGTARPHACVSVGRVPGMPPKWPSAFRAGVAQSVISAYGPDGASHLPKAPALRRAWPDHSWAYRTARASTSRTLSARGSSARLSASRYELRGRDSHRERKRCAVLLGAGDVSGLFVGARTKLEDRQLGTVPGRLDDPVSGDAEAL